MGTPRRICQWSVDVGAARLHKREAEEASANGQLNQTEASCSLRIANSVIQRLLHHINSDGSWPGLPARGRTKEPSYVIETARRTACSDHCRPGILSGLSCSFSIAVCQAFNVAGYCSPLPLPTKAPCSSRRRPCRSVSYHANRERVRIPDLDARRTWEGPNGVSRIC